MGNTDIILSRKNTLQSDKSDEVSRLNISFEEK